MNSTLLKYRGRGIGEDDISLMRRLIAEHPTASRRQLSKLLAVAWQFTQANGQLRDMVCRGLMLAAHRSGLIELPPVRHRPKNNVILRRVPSNVDIDRTPITGTLAELQPLELRQVRRTSEEPLFDALIQAHHYLGYTRPVGEHLKHMISARGRPIALFAWSSPARALRLRDRFIGWSREARSRNLHLIAHNTRFLILPWVRVPHLASHLLGWMARCISSEWERVYAHPIHYLESYVDPARFAGTCYRAANWHFLGRTSGRGNNAPTCTPRVPVKQVLGLPLARRFRELLGTVGCL